MYVNENQSGILGLFQACSNTLQNGVYLTQHIASRLKYQYKSRFDSHLYMYRANLKSKLMTTECQEDTLLTTFQLHVKVPLLWNRLVKP